MGAVSVHAGHVPCAGDRVLAANRDRTSSRARCDDGATMTTRSCDDGRASGCGVNCDRVTASVMTRDDDDVGCVCLDCAIGGDDLVICKHQTQCCLGT